MPADSVLAEYQTTLRQLHASIARADAAQKISLSVLLIAVAALIAVFVSSAVQRRVPLWWAVLPLPIVAGAGPWYAGNRRRWSRFLRLRNFYEGGVARMEDRWHGNGFSGEEFRIPNHVYDVDLQVLGTGSLFELICTARTGLGRRRVAGYLLKPCGIAEAAERQDAVRELKPRIEVRERLALLGKYDFQESEWAVFAGWLAIPAMPAPMWVRVVAAISSAAIGVLALAGFVTSLPWGVLALWSTPFPALLTGIAWYFRNRTNTLNDAARRVGMELGVTRAGIEMAAGLTFRSARLQSIQRRLREGNAVSSLRRLERMTGTLAQCDKQHLELASHLLAVRTQLCFAIEAWKFRHAANLEGWLDAWAEFEALAAISGYAWEHPDDVFPEFAEGPSSFTAEGLGHPLLPAGTCVRNDVALHSGKSGETGFYIVSGSNMAGKSTLLRSIGLNAVLANAGAPVRAVAMQLTALEVFASLSIVDSILEGKSKFLAEVERVRQTLDRARAAPVLFLIDEILSGTNSRDRRIAAEAIVRTLRQHGAIGVLSTHDLALTEIADLEGFAGCNIHMGSGSQENPMDFDFLAKPGVTTESSALAIARMMGVPV